jgi:hypothetical protein
MENVPRPGCLKDGSGKSARRDEAKRGLAEFSIRAQGLGIQRGMVGIFGHQSRGRRWLWQAGGHRSGALALGLGCTVPTAGIFGLPGDQHPEPRRHDVSRSLLSSPIRCRSPWQHGQFLPSMSMTPSIRDRCAHVPRLIGR